MITNINSNYDIFENEINKNLDYKELKKSEFIMAM